MELIRFVDVVVQCAMPEEANAVMDACGEVSSVHTTESPDTHVFLGPVQTFVRQRLIRGTLAYIKVAVVTQVRQGMDEASVTAIVLPEIFPDAQIFYMCGIAAGSREEFKLGDVALLRTARNEVGRIESDNSKTFRIKPIEVLAEVERSINELVESSGRSRMRRPYNIKSAGIISGNFVLRRFDFLGFQKLSGSQETQVVDMEVEAFYYSLNKHVGKKFLAVKGISDFADSDKGDDFHTTAAQNAALTLLEHLDNFAHILEPGKRHADVSESILKKHILSNEQEMQSIFNNVISSDTARKYFTSVLHASENISFSYIQKLQEGTLLMQRQYDFTDLRESATQFLSNESSWYWGISTFDNRHVSSCYWDSISGKNLLRWNKDLSQKGCHVERIFVLPHPAEVNENFLKQLGRYVEEASNQTEVGRLRIYIYVYNSQDLASKDLDDFYMYGSGDNPWMVETYNHNNYGTITERAQHFGSAILNTYACKFRKWRDRSTSLRTYQELYKEAEARTFSTPKQNLRKLSLLSVLKGASKRG